MAWTTAEILTTAERLGLGNRETAILLRAAEKLAEREAALIASRARLIEALDQMGRDIAEMITIRPMEMPRIQIVPLETDPLLTKSSLKRREKMIPTPSKTSWEAAQAKLEKRVRHPRPAKRGRFRSRRDIG